jgi:hypothetical protein
MKRQLLLLAFMAPLLAANLQIETRFPEEKLYIGDRIRISYRIQTKEDIRVDVPDPTALAEDFELLDSDLLHTEKRKEQYWEFRLEAVAFDTGFIHIPAFPLIATDVREGLSDTLFLPEKYLYIYSVLDSDAAALPQKPPLPLAFMRWWEYLLVLLLLSGAGYLLFRALRGRRKASAAEAAEEWRSPAERAEAALRLLEEKQYPQKKEWKAFYLELTRICREYYEGIFFIHLQELTTRELLPVLHERLPESRYRKLEDFFHFADLVKFAKTAASEVRAGEDLEMIKKMISEQEREIQAAQIISEAEAVPEVTR